jgi:TetR/AcrR family transcriptional regulator, transcriptional repressor for nem operon
MRYAKGQKLHIRNRILERASYGLLRKGIHGISVADLMKLAGMTHGGFYTHFESREALVIEAFALAIDRTVDRWLKLIKGKPVGIEAIVESYLNRYHRDNPGNGCPLPSLSADISRSSPETRRTFTKKLDGMIDVLTRLFPRESAEVARQDAVGALATMIGSIVLARAVGNKMLSDDILEAGRQAVRNQAAFRNRCGHSGEKNGSGVNM